MVIRHRPHLRTSKCQKSRSRVTRQAGTNCGLAKTSGWYYQGVEALPTERVDHSMTGSSHWQSFLTNRTGLKTVWGLRDLAFKLTFKARAWVEWMSKWFFLTYRHMFERCGQQSGGWNRINDPVGLNNHTQSKPYMSVFQTEQQTLSIINIVLLSSLWREATIPKGRSAYIHRGWQGCP